MWLIYYSLHIIVGSLYLTLLAPLSFGSNPITQEEMPEKTFVPATTPQVAVPFSPESTLPHDIRVHVLSFLPAQTDLLRIGAVSTSWRKAAEKVWEHKVLDLSNRRLKPDDFIALGRGIFSHVHLNDTTMGNKDAYLLSTAFLRGNDASTTQRQTSFNLFQRFITPIQGLQKAPISKNESSPQKAEARPLLSSSLKTLMLAHNRIQAKGMKSLFELSTLTSLSLCSNGLHDKDLKVLSKSLRICPSFTSLDLSCNHITDEGAKSLQKLFSGCTFLSSVRQEASEYWSDKTKAKAIPFKKQHSLMHLRTC